jgi:hypothetical protein
MRTIAGVIVGVLVLFPGVTLLKWIAVSSGAYGAVTLTDALLAMIIMLLTIHLVRGTSPLGSHSAARSRATARTRRSAGPPDGYAGEPQPFLPGERPERPLRKPTGRRTTTRRER